MKTKTLTIVLIALMVSCCWVVQTDAQQGRGKWRNVAGPGPGCFAGIDLTQEQLTKINMVRSNFLKDTVSLRADIHEKKLELKALMLDVNPDADKALEQQEKMFELKKKLAQKRLRAQLEVKKLLTPEQNAQLPPGCNYGFGRKGDRWGPGFRGSAGPGWGCAMW